MLNKLTVSISAQSTIALFSFDKLHMNASSSIYVKKSNTKQRLSTM